jgi:hypothetical protein
VPGDARAGQPGSGAAARLILALALLAAGPAAAQGPAYVQVGWIRAVYWPGDERLAISLAEMAERAGPWPGLPEVAPFPVTLIVTRSAARYDSLTAGRLPEWSGAAAFPGSGTIVLRVQGNPVATLRHEMAHLVLARVAPHVPRWFAEGYAVRAAGDWEMVDALALNWRLLRGRPPTFRELDDDLRAGPAHARAAYTLAASAVAFLERIGGERGLEPLLARLREARGFEPAVRAAHRMAVEELEAAWHRDLRRRYGWLLLTSSMSLFWGGTALVVGYVWWRRRRRDRARREALDEGWEVPAPDAPNA